MRAPRSIPANGKVRNSRTALRRPVAHSHTQESLRGPVEVLYWLPFQGRRAALQFHSFDEAYVERLRAGDFRTQQHFVGYFSHLMQIKLGSRVKSPEGIEDVRQETFARVLTALRDGKILHPERLGPYVNSICTHVLQEYYRAGSRDGCFDHDDDTDYPDDSVDLFAALSTKETGEKVREVLEELPERDRRLLREIFLEEKDKNEVCHDFGVDRDYLRVLLHRAKQSFKSLYFNNLDKDPPAAATA
ncbi:MAG: sigma-70 family RNA polymerase sigma factor [Candidatus Sulfotelmatobacter sp.]|jgi:RNA polymerase sigma-70 factor, ECF subfamily